MFFESKLDFYLSWTVRVVRLLYDVFLNTNGYTWEKTLVASKAQEGSKAQTI